MKCRSFLFVFALVLAMLACNLPSSAATATPTLSLITPSLTQPLPTNAPTQTLLPSTTPPPTATGTPTVPVAFPKEVGVNCRLGPGVGWVVLSGLSVGTSSQISGKSGDGGWWYIVDPFNSGRKCWVASSVTNTAGNVAGIPVVEAPKAAVTKVSLKVSPDTINAAACPAEASPIEVAGTIETNGPTEVTWHLETQQTGVLTPQTIEFDAFGSTDFSTNYTPTLTAGTYWIRLIITSPNDMQAETKYTITCPAV
jgi:hypothetical protein